MNHADHVALIRDGVTGAGRRWLELGAGRGAFTLALLDLLGTDAEVTAVDRDAAALDALRVVVDRRFPTARLSAVVADFTAALPTNAGAFDGVLMANSLHFVHDKEPIVRDAIRTVRPGGRFILVEYDSDHGNRWVPWPLSFQAWLQLAASVGLRDTRKIGEVPSRFLGSIYAAASVGL
ncbi:MAG: class I SAM-dependent methyltransferase [Chloroflexota bacterium]|nr:class I SAM-dependent methyltransferase [Chloroflexota bacterium]